MSIQRNAALDAMDHEFAARLDTFLAVEQRPLRVLMASAAGWEIVDFVETGEKRQVSSTIADATYVIDVPVRAPEVRWFAESFDGLMARTEFANPRDDGYELLRDEEKREADALLAPYREQLSLIEQELVSCFMKTVEQAPLLSTDMRRKCTNCKGDRQFVFNHCSCTSRTIRYVEDDSPQGEGGYLSVEEPPSSSPEPECPTCHGSGRSVSMCVVCGGSGLMPVTQEVSVIGPGKGKYSFLADVAELVRRGLALPVVHSRLGFGERIITVVLGLDFSPLINAISDTVTESQPFHIHWYPWESWEHGMHIAAIDLAPDPTTEEAVLTGVVLSRNPETFRLEYTTVPLDIDLAAAYALQELQDLIVNGFSFLAEDSTYRGKSSVRADDNCSLQTDIVAQRRLPCVEMLDLLVREASVDGYRIGLKYAFVATGEHGPALYLMGPDRIGIAELGLGRSWIEVLTEALMRLPAVIEKHKSAQSSKEGYDE